MSPRTRVAAVLATGALTLGLSGGPASASELVPDPVRGGVAPVAVEAVVPPSVRESVASPVGSAVDPAVDPVTELLIQNLAVPAPPAPTERSQPAPSQPSQPLPPDLLAPDTDAAPLDAVTTLVNAVIGLIEGSRSLPPVFSAPPAQPIPAADPDIAPGIAPGIAPDAASDPAATSAPQPLTPSWLAFALPRQATAGDGGPNAAIFGSLGRLAREMTSGDDRQRLSPFAAPFDTAAPSLLPSELFPALAPVESFLPTGSGSPANLPALLVAVAAIAVAVSAGGHAAEVRRRKAPVIAD